ncbi:MAG: aminodeoxychorismate/anthranilate synthase component II [Deltaproteobacteria bacterium]|nr:aminodeoxychorismate/anthranilate synthase component II [Deltaproteobacteria bacterium]
MILMIDNYDSFTFNLVQYFMELGEDVLVRRNDAITIADIGKLAPDAIVVSPGPCDPPKAGISVEAIKSFAGKVPILGVCLGHQSIGYAFGGEVVKAGRLMHGKTSMVFHDGKTIFEGIENPFEAIEVSAWTSMDEIMGLRHKELPIEGVQFHPESILTRAGKDILKNFLKKYTGKR